MLRVQANIITSLPPPGRELLAAARVAPPTRPEHDRFAAEIPALAAIEQTSPAEPLAVDGRITVAAFNVERGRSPQAVARLLAEARVDVALLTELDVGMARSSNRHTLADIAAPLAAGYTFAVEFVELGLGDARERSQHAGAENTIALHGNAILSRHELADPWRIALDEGGLWFDGARNGERRIGGRMAVAARLTNAKRPIWFASVHLESHSDADDRARQIDKLVRAVDRLSGDAAAVIGGDLNTNRLPKDTGKLAAMLEDPSSIEPLFQRLRLAGFDWRTVNTPEPTQRTRMDGTPRPPFNRIDWLAVRGVNGGAPRTIAAVDEMGWAISDHDMVVAEINL